MSEEIKSQIESYEKRAAEYEAQGREGAANWYREQANDLRRQYSE